MPASRCTNPTTRHSGSRCARTATTTSRRSSWQWWAPELWRRFTIALKRRLAQLLGADPDRLGDVASLQYAKVAEYQQRGAVHFHSLIRLDGPPTADGFAAASMEITASVLAKVVEQVAADVTLTVGPVTPDGTTRVLAFGAQVDTRVVRTSRRTDDPNAPLSGEQVAGYLAKYATKSATGTEARDNAHLRRLHATARRLATEANTIGDPTDPYRLLGRWAHTLGFRGHFSTKFRRYSVTLGRLRRARQRAQIRIAAAARAGTTVDLRDLEPSCSPTTPTKRRSSSDPGRTPAVAGPTRAMRRWPPRRPLVPASTPAVEPVHDVRRRTPNRPTLGRGERDDDDDERTRPAARRPADPDDHREVADLLHVNPSTVCRWRQTGTGPRVTWLSARMPRYQRRHVVTWIERMSR